ncbi:hypothetical protein AAW51_2653 [Caldimonas brevitalea]|uniref:Pentapeptide repeat-containing protein n=1 Tax=Caldimonas brevitalea TaxID=413882 RepID=A0A0G3BIS9_9BURK|nr:hypothetical protein AAW51_2653 [Caldimonas brevitalea]
MKCDFGGCALKNIEFGTSALQKVRINGRLEKCFFRGELRECDFVNAVFFDCAFYGAEFTGCSISDHALLFDNWRSAFQVIQEGSRSRSMSADSRQALEQMCRIWLKVSDYTKQELIDRRDLQEAYGEEVANEVYAYLAEIKSAAKAVG